MHTVTCEGRSREVRFEGPIRVGVDVHKNSYALMSAIPIPDVLEKRDRIILQGEVPNPLNPPAGCRFHTRCARARGICSFVLKDHCKTIADYFTKTY